MYQRRTLKSDGATRGWEDSLSSSTSIRLSQEFINDLEDYLEEEYGTPRKKSKFIRQAAIEKLAEVMDE